MAVTVSIQHCRGRCPDHRQKVQLPRSGPSIRRLGLAAVIAIVITVLSVAIYRRMSANFTLTCCDRRYWRSQPHHRSSRHENCVTFIAMLPPPATSSEKGSILKRRVVAMETFVALDHVSISEISAGVSIRSHPVRTVPGKVDLAEDPGFRNCETALQGRRGAAAHRLLRSSNSERIQQ